MICSMDEAAKMALRWAALNANPWAVIVSAPEPPATWYAVSMSCTVKLVPVALLLATVKPCKVLCDRSSTASDVINLALRTIGGLPATGDAQKLEIPTATALLICTVRFSLLPYKKNR